MLISDIDPETRQVAAAKRRELEWKFLNIKFKRCQKGIPINPDWVNLWRQFIDKSVAGAVEQHLSRRDALFAKRYKRPIAPASAASASQVAQKQNLAVGRSNSV